MIDLATVRERIKTHGPTRVVVSVTDGLYAVPPDAALRDYGIVADVVFIRNDGWSLGCRMWETGPTAALWAGEWVDCLMLYPGTLD